MNMRDFFRSSVAAAVAAASHGIAAPPPHDTTAVMSSGVERLRALDLTEVMGLHRMLDFSLQKTSLSSFSF